MRKIRIGNDIHIQWSILNNGQPFSLEGKDVRILLKTPAGIKQIEDYEIHGNKITWVFYGKNQKSLGVYSITLKINDGAEGMATIDACDFVQLVRCSCQESGKDAENVTTEPLSLTSSFAYVGGGSSYDDSELRTEIAKKADKEYVDTAVSEKVDAALEGYATKEEVSKAIAEIDLSNYATKEDVSKAISSAITTTLNEEV